jgi:hypothetical protein
VPTRLQSLRQRLAGRPVAAAASRIELSQPAKARKQAGRRQPWQEQNWGYFDVIPEVKTSTWFLGNAVSRVKLVVATRGPDGKPMLASAPDSGVSPEIAALAQAELDRLRGPWGGQPEILREAEMNLKVAGEFFLVGWGQMEPTVSVLGVEIPGRPESWEVRSISEVVIQGSGASATYLIKDDPSDKGVPLNPDTDTIIRMWKRHPRWSALADCELNGARGECEALVTLHAELLADSRSRHNAGIVTLPNELSFQGPPDDGEDVGDGAVEDPFADEFSETFTDPVDDPLEPGAVAPAAMRGPGEWLKPDYVRWMDMGRKPSGELDAKINNRVARLARGLGLPVEKIMGHQSTTFANAAQVDADEFTDYVEPDVQLLVDCLTVGFLVPNLEDDGLLPAEAASVFVWYDASDAIRDPDMTAAADAAHDRFEISSDGYRRLRGIPDDMAPDPLEQITRAALKRGVLSQDVALAILQMLPQGPSIEVVPIPRVTDSQQLPAGEDPAVPNDSTDTSGDSSAATATSMAGVLARHPAFTASLLERRLRRPDAIVASGRPKRNVVEGLGRRLMAVDMDLRSRLLVLANATVDRALEKAGNRLRAQASFRPLVASVGSRHVAAHLGRALIADAGMDPAGLLDDTMSTMREQFMAWGETAQADAIEAVSRAVGGFTEARRAELQLRQADSLEEAWTWLHDALVGRAEQVLFDPAVAAAETVGEVASGAGSVPAGLIRQALSIAGGSPSVATRTGSDAFVTLSSEQYEGGIGTGSLVNDVLDQMGYGTEGYEWVYGPSGRSRPFEPHVELDGVTFEDWTDPVLAVEDSFPDGGYYLPGDHGGCLCDVAPVIIAPDGATTIDA